ncbi:hypothetical protein PCANC_22207 [Puccinia coronata f. sp. avenae]|uniref:Uncharacterized protein n=1 Tax=Puccinia coronata f. sp. avenae TaxID=200324 RepID=A0A2N5SJJ1_9BASI|nr:hypothetical protein PCANC_22207 [Puccinia coronata f. sp. avenae]
MSANLPIVRRLGRSTILAAEPLPLVRWSGRSITPAYQRLALGPIWLTLVDPLDRMGIGVAGSDTRPVSTQPSLFSPLLCFLPGISTGRIVGFPFFLPQRSTARRMTLCSLLLLLIPPPFKLPPNAAPPPFEDLYFDSNGVLFRNGVAVVDQHGSLIRRSIVERPPPTLVAPETLVLRSNHAVIGHAAHRISPPVFDPYPAFVESRSVPQVIPGYPRGPVPPGLESLVEHLHHNGQGANSASEDAQMRPASKTRGRLIGDPARIAEATRVFNEAHDLIVDHFYNTAAPPVPRPASEPRAPTTDPIDTDSDPADAQSEPLLTNDQGDPVSTTYPFTNLSCPATPNPPGFFDPEDYHWLDDDQIHALLRRDHEPARFDRFAFGPQHLTDLYQSAMSAMVSNYTRFPPRDGAECADRVQTFKFITRRYHSLDRVMRRQ